MPVYNFIFERNKQDNIIIMDKNGIQKININDFTYGKIKYRGIDWLPGIKNIKDIKNENKLILSEEEKIILISNHNGFGAYLITE